ncbi:hypothetical protein ACWDWU_01030 [Streptomyces sp. NPDC003442]
MTDETIPTDAWPVFDAAGAIAARAGFDVVYTGKGVLGATDSVPKRR